MKATTDRLKCGPQNFFPQAVTILLLLAVLCYIPLCPAQAEEGDSQYPQPWQEFYYYDEPGIISEATRADILAKNGPLSETYGVEIVVLAVNNLPSGDFSQRVAYLRGLMQNWQVGGSDGRGLLLALSVADDDYLAVAGDKLKDSFTTESLKSLLDSQLEPDFSAKAYDAGISKFFTAAAAQAESYCAAHAESFGPDAQGGQGHTVSGNLQEKKKSSGSNVLLWVACTAGGVAVISIVIFILASHSGSRRRGNRRGVHRGRPVITPSRTNVLRYESRPTVHIRSSNRSTGVYRNQKTTRSRTNFDRRP